MPVEPAKKVFEPPYIIKKEENIKGAPHKKKKNLKKDEKKGSGKIDIRV